jgi:soluble lytic murein transglycosylase-like protein
VARDSGTRRRIVGLLSILVAFDVVVAVVVILVIGASNDDAEPRPQPKLPAFVEPQKHHLEPAFKRAARENELPVALLEALAWRESRWRTEAYNPDSGALGIGQLLPETATFVAGELLDDPTLDPADPQDNIRMMARYLRAQVESFNGDRRLALAAYLQGSTSVQADGVSTTTAAYLADIEEIRERFEAAARGHAGSALDPLSEQPSAP